MLKKILFFASLPYARGSTSHLQNRPTIAAVHKRVLAKLPKPAAGGICPPVVFVEKFFGPEAEQSFAKLNHALRLTECFPVECTVDPAVSEGRPGSELDVRLASRVMREVASEFFRTDKGDQIIVGLFVGERRWIPLIDEIQQIDPDIRIALVAEKNSLATGLREEISRRDTNYLLFIDELFPDLAGGEPRGGPDAPRSRRTTRS